MIAAGAAAKAVLATLGMLAVQGTIVTLLALILTRAKRPAWQAAVWLVVLAKFALPVGPAMPYSLSDVIALFTEPSGGHVIVGATKGMTHAAPSILPAFGWLFLASVWAIGTVFVLARGLLGYRATLRDARAATYAPPEAQALLAELAFRMHVRKPRLVVGSDAIGPYVIGVLRPIIVVPPSLSGELLRAALLHELAHVRRRDAFGRMIQLAAVALFWWCPVVRFANRRLELARESACDAWALESGEVSRPGYARLLLQMAQLRVANATALAAPHALDARINSVLGPVHRPRLSHVHKLALALWALVVLGGARSAAAHGKQNVCIYTPQLAEALYQAYPEADIDGDGVLSRTEACEFQAEMKKRDEVSTPLLAEPLCCNCGDSAEPLQIESTCTAEGSK